MPYDEVDFHYQLISKVSKEEAQADSKYKKSFVEFLAKSFKAIAKSR